MCGILLTYGIEEGRSLDSLNEVYYRGPFNKGEVRIDGVGIGMVQLPMKSIIKDNIPFENDDYVVSYNGEIYDDSARNLQAEIEIAIKSIDAKIPINGMFALAAYKKKSKEIILARDEFGIKPLYYYIDERRSTFIACSEITPILRLIGKTFVNKKTLSEILTLGSQAGEDTVFSGVKLLEQGTVLRICLPLLKVKRYHIPTLLPAGDDLDELIFTSVQSCTKDTFREPSLLISDGLDSNLLLTFLPESIRKYNVVVDGNALGVNERTYQNLKQTSLNGSNADFYISKAICSYAQPCRMSSILMYQALSELIAKDKNHLVLGGEGADEFFWGYPRHLALNNQETQLISNIFFPDLDAGLDLIVDKIYRDHVISIISGIDRMQGDRISVIDYMDKKFSLEPLLRRTDHLLMRNTIETRVPYLHFGIPNFGKRHRNRRVRGESSKILLMELMEKRGRTYISKKKSHFRAPVEKWYSQTSFDHFFNKEDVEVLDLMGLSIPKLKLSYDRKKFGQIFIAKTIVIWYEQFKTHLH